jgi:hypothetical protein
MVNSGVLVNSSFKRAMETERRHDGGQKFTFTEVPVVYLTTWGVCAFPVKRPPSSAGDPTDTSEVLKTLASEVPGVEFNLKPFKSGGFKVSFQATPTSRSRDSATKIISAAPTFLKRHGLAVTRDCPLPL